MGILDSILGLNTSNGTQAAVQAGQQALGNTAASNAGLYGQTAAAAAGAQRTAATNATNAINQGYGAGVGAVTNYGNQAQTSLANGIGNAVGTVLGGNSAFQPYAASGGAASSMLSNALGLNGASGNTAATSAFQASPGYQFQLNQATDQAARTAASLGMAASGNTLQAITGLSSNLANQEWGNWLSNLSGVGNQGLTAASGMSSNNQAAGSLQGTGATTGAQLLQNTGSNLGTLLSGQGTALGNIQTNLGNALSQIQQYKGTGTAQSNLSTALGSASLGLTGGMASDAATNASNNVLSGDITSFGKGILSALKL